MKQQIDDNALTTASLNQRLQKEVLAKAQAQAQVSLLKEQLKSHADTAGNFHI